MTAAVEKRGAVPKGSGRESIQEGWWLEADPWGGCTLYEKVREGSIPRRRVVLDNAGRIQSLYRWAGSGAPGGRTAAGEVPPAATGLLAAALRLPSGGWLEIQPAAAHHPIWGLSDRLGHWGEAVQGEAGWVEAGRASALDWECPAHIPAMDSPARLPRGGGSAVLNAVAALMAEQGVESACYRGPYPTQQLYRALHRSFRCLAAPEAAEIEFTRDELTLAFSPAMVENPVRWAPHPHGQRRVAEGMALQLRDEPEALWLGATPFRPGPPGGVGLAAGERLWVEPGPDGPEWHAGLVLLGAPFRTFVVLDAAGTLLRTLNDWAEPAEGAPAGAALSERWGNVVFSWAALTCPPPLAKAVADLKADTRLCWSPLRCNLAVVRGGEIYLQAGWGEQFRKAAPARPRRELALMAISDVLEAVAPHLRRLAQRRIAPAPLERLMERGGLAQQVAHRELERAMPALLAEVERGEGLPKSEKDS